MGIRSLAADLGITFDILLRTDASAALRVVNRRGVGKTRHIDTLELWLLAGEENVAGILTMNVKSGVHRDNDTRDGRRVDGCT